jgi:hypothetical protein
MALTVDELNDRLDVAEGKIGQLSGLVKAMDILSGNLAEQQMDKKSQLGILRAGICAISDAMMSVVEADEAGSRP